MMGRGMVVRRRPMLRAAAIGGTFAAGRAMGRRAGEGTSAEQSQPAQAQPAQAQPAQTGGAQQPGQEATGQAGGAPVLDQLGQLATLHQQGALTDAEFTAAKAKILGR